MNNVTNQQLKQGIVALRVHIKSTIKFTMDERTLKNLRTNSSRQNAR